MKNHWKTRIGAALLALVLFAALTGCPTESDSGSDSGGPEVDVLVVGSGIAGNLAALGAKEAGASKVMLIEKMAYYGGTSRLAGGGFSQLEAKTKAQEFLTTWGAHALAPANYPFPDYDKLYSVASNVADTVDYLAALGIPFTISDRDPPRLKYAQTIGNGAALLSRLQRIVTDQGIEVLLECKADELIVEGGAVTGVKAAYEGASKTIRAKNVILATGGFSQNPELVAEWDGGITGLRDVIPGTDPSATGDGIRMALGAGAVLYNINGDVNTFTDISGLTFAAAVNSVAGASALRSFPNLSYQIIVDPQGNRFTNEHQDITQAPYGNVAYNRVIHDIVVHGRGPYWVIFDSNNPNQIGGSTVVLNTVLASAVTAAPNEVKTAASIADLAAAIGASNLAATVSTYSAGANADASSGTDSAFNKPAAYVTKTFAAGPYYAVKIYAQTLGSMGGVVTDLYGRVLNEEGKIIPHLYAVGETSNRDFYGQSYVGGGSLGLYSTMGRRAGKTAAADK